MTDAGLGLLLIAMGCVLPVLAAWAIVRHRQRREARQSLANVPRALPTADSRH